MGDKRKMTYKDKIKFAIRYLKQGLKSKRTPPLYEELMKELGFVSEKELGKVEGKLADLTSEYYELENLKNNEIAELKASLQDMLFIYDDRSFNKLDCDWNVNAIKRAGELARYEK